jgi:hypothetical protein
LFRQVLLVSRSQQARATSPGHRIAHKRFVAYRIHLRTSRYLERLQTESANVCCRTRPSAETLHESRTRLPPSLLRVAILRSFRLRPPSYLVPTKSSVISHCLCSNASTSLEESSDKSCPKTSKVSNIRPRDQTLLCHYTQAARTCLRLAI